MVRSIDHCILRPIARAIVARCHRSYEHSWHPVTERTINRGTRRPMVRSIVWCNDRSHDQAYHRATDRMINRCDIRPIIRSIVTPNDLESQVSSFEHDHRPCYDRFCPGDHPRPLRPVVRSFYDLPTIPCNLVVRPV